MKIKRKQTWNAYGKSWCPKCKKKTKLHNIGGSLPGIPQIQCKECKSYFTINFLESEDDILECPDSFKFPKND